MVCIGKWLVVPLSGFCVQMIVFLHQRGGEPLFLVTGMVEGCPDVHYVLRRKAVSADPQCAMDAAPFEVMYELPSSLVGI